MRTMLTGLIALITVSTVVAQQVVESVTFDSPDDFQNFFTNGTGLTQIPFNGITGGCLETPQTISWGNDNAVYCTRLEGLIGETYRTGISFKYDTLAFNTINFDRPVSIWMRPITDFNHYLIASILHTQGVQVVGYSNAITNVPMPLQQGHWYDFQVMYEFVGGPLSDQINTTTQVNDLGVTGTDPPIPVSTGYTNTVFYDSTLIADTAIEISVTGTLWGGARYLDNFRFEGLKSFDNCIATAMSDPSTTAEIRIQVNKSILTASCLHRHPDYKLRLFNLNGQEVFKANLKNQISSFNLTNLPNGIYSVLIENNFGSQLIKQKVLLLE